MSASAPKSLSSSKEWLVLLPDNADQLSQRLKVRQDHLSNIQPSVASGKVLVGGATLTKHPEEGETPQMTGSVLLVTAETEEEVRKLVAGDIYTTSGVWDPNAFTIRPFKTAIKHGVQVGQKPWG